MEVSLRESSHESCHDVCSLSLVDHCWSNSMDQSLASQIQTSFMIVILVSSIVLNVIIMVTIGSNRRMQTVTNVFAVSLAVSDILLAFVADINAVLVVYQNNSSRQINILRRVFVFFVSFVMICNHLNHLVISLERWLFIARPFRHQRLVTTRLIVCSLLAVWVIPFGSSVNLLVDSCGINLEVAKLQVCVVFSVVHFFMSVVQFLIYSHIVVITRRQHKLINKNRISGESVDMNEVNKMLLNLRASWKQVRLFVIVFGTFFIFETPWVVANILAFSTNDTNIYTSGVMRIAVTLSLFQCFSNFVTRFFLDSEFRLTLKRGRARIRSLCRCGRVDPVIIKVSSVNGARPSGTKSRSGFSANRPIQIRSLSTDNEGDAY